VVSVAVITRDRDLYQQLSRAFPGRIELFARLGEVPRDRCYSSYVVDLEAGDFGRWDRPGVETGSQAESTFVFVVDRIAPLADLGVLPPRSVVFEKTKGLVPRLRDFLISPAKDGDPDKRFRSVGYAETTRTLSFTFLSGRSVAVGLADFEASDGSAVSRMSLSPDGSAVVVEQESGNTFALPWDAVLRHADPDSLCQKPPLQAGERERAVIIGQKVRDERRTRRWTLADLSARTEIKVPNLCRLEKGKHLPSLETLERVADALGMSVAALVAKGAHLRPESGV
jgi:hypothetical protein